MVAVLATFMTERAEPSLLVEVTNKALPPVRLSAVSCTTSAVVIPWPVSTTASLSVDDEVRVMMPFASILRRSVGEAAPSGVMRNLRVPPSALVPTLDSEVDTDA